MIEFDIVTTEEGTYSYSTNGGDVFVWLRGKKYISNSRWDVDKQVWSKLFLSNVPNRPTAVQIRLAERSAEAVKRLEAELWAEWAYRRFNQKGKEHIVEAVCKKFGMLLGMDV